MLPDNQQTGIQIETLKMANSIELEIITIDDSRMNRISGVCGYCHRYAAGHPRI